MIRGQIQLPDSAWIAFYSNPTLVDWFRQAQAQLVSLVPVIRLDDLDNQTVFPAVPETPDGQFGYGMLATPKGMYEAILGDSPVVPQWRRMSDGTVFAVGAVIPTTL